MPLKSISVYGSFLGLRELVNNKLIHQYRKAFYITVDQVSKLGLGLPVGRNFALLGRGFSYGRIVCFC